MSKKKKSRDSNLDKRSLKNNILGVFTSNPSKTFNYKQISSALFIKDPNARKLIGTLLNELAGDDTLEEIQTGKYRLKSKTGYVTGKVEITQAGYGFATCDEIQGDVFISQRNLNHALNGDTVKIFIHAKKHGINIEGEVVEIINREKSSFVGIIEMSKHFAFLIPDSKHMPYDIFIPLENLNGAKNGEIAVAKITDWPRKAKNPYGEIIDVLGTPGDNEAEMHAILAEFELPYKFTPEVEEEAEKIPEEIPESEYKIRRDFRKITTFTIDPVDAKDFDDALSIQTLKNGNYEIGVHIADVTHYIKPKTLLDDEALERATSVYLVDRVVPMLPEKLSNKVCSLRPNEEKLCFSAVFEITSDADIINEWFGKTVINSDRRFAYEEAQEILDTREGDFAEELNTLNSIARKLREQRFSTGSIAFERDEVKFELDDKGKPTRVFFKQHGESNELIEEFMLLANKRVANFIGNVEKNKKAKTFVYRIHDKPNAEKLYSFQSFIRRYGFKLNMKSEKTLSSSLNNVLDSVKGTREQNIIENLALRAMAKAEYSTKNIGHYGLSFKFYSHFTSPIRRYPDMMVHRLLFHYINNGDSKPAKQYEQWCKHSSEMERRAIEAERSSIKYKQVEFMSEHIGKIFDGIISGITDWGLFVELNESKCEGFISIKDLKDDFYIYDNENYQLIGKHFQKIYQLGDDIKVVVLRTNLAKKQLDFAVVE